MFQPARADASIKEIAQHCDAKKTIAIPSTILGFGELASKERRPGDETRLKHRRGLLLRRFCLTQHVAKIIIGVL
jgi:hypothetical protein